MEDNRFALGGFDRQPLLLGLLRDSAKLLTLFVCSSTQINVEATERISAVPILLWLLGVPLSVVVVLWLVHVI